jgi:AcrR family transcriptional regulator
MPPESRGQRRRSPRVQQKREQARQDIQQAAQQLLREKGVDGVTLASVASALGMTKPALYHYFPSKQALMRSLVTSLIDDEVEALIAAIEAADSADSAETTLGALIRAFYAHYIHRLDAFRTVYCQSQLYSGPSVGMDEETIRDEINPRTQHLFDELEKRLAGASMSRSKRGRMRRLAFTAWASALGLLTMLSVADAIEDPLIHADEDLLDTLVGVFDQAAKR